MASSTTAEIVALLETKLATVEVDGADAFGEIFAYAKADFSKYPVAVIKAAGGRGVEIDTHRIERTFSFDVTIYQEESHAGRTSEAATEIQTAVVDAVMQSFDRDPDLGGEVETVRVVEWDTNFGVRAGVFSFATFKVDVVAIVPNYDG